MTPHLTTHITLLHRLAEGSDAAAWRDFCARYEALIRRVAHLHGLGRADGDDVLQDVLLAMAKALPSFEYDPAKGRFRSYLKTVTLRTIYRRLRQNPRAMPLQSSGDAAPEADEAGAERIWEAEWRQHHLRLALSAMRAELSERDMAVFEDCVYSTKETNDIAAEHQTSAANVYQIKSRGLRRLGAIIATQIEEEG